MHLNLFPAVLLGQVAALLSLRHRHFRHFLHILPFHVGFGFHFLQLILKRERILFSSCVRSRKRTRALWNGFNNTRPVTISFPI